MMNYQQPYLQFHTVFDLLLYYKYNLATIKFVEQPTNLQLPSPFIYKINLFFWSHQLFYNYI